MMKTRNLLTLFFVVIMATLPGVQAEAKNDIPIQRGMTKEKVISLLGKPENTSFNQYGEQWEYYKSGWPLKWDKRILVGFDTQGKVVTYHSETLRPEDDTKKVKVETMPAAVTLPLVPYPGEVYGMSDDAFTVLYNKVKAANFDDTRCDLIEVASLGCYYSCRQCAGILRLFDFDNNRMKALKYIAPRLVDAQNANEIYNLFDFDSDKDKAAKMIQSCLPAPK